MRVPALMSSRPGCLLVAGIVVIASLLLPQPVSALGPDSPEVKARIKRALGYLANANDERLGGTCLIALCFKKNGAPNDHPKIKFAMDKCAKTNPEDVNVDMYSMGIALMFLCEVDPKGNLPLIEKYLQGMLSRQKGHGGFGYKEYATGDTSQTQYAVLGMWMAVNFAKIQIPVEKQEAVCGWLMRTQEPGGGWGYQGIDPGSLNRRAQNGVSPTLTAAGAGSTYIMADLLQVTQRKDAGTTGRPKAIQVAEAAAKGGPGGRGPLTKDLNPEDIKGTLALADRWMGANFVMPTTTWNHYYMYALERYHSFREEATGVRDERWYKAGFDYLAKTQQQDGSWAGEDNNTIATALATLFLLRSSLKAIEKRIQMVEGVARGNRGLPDDVSNIQIEKGKVVTEAVTIPTDTILELLESNDSKIDDIAEEREVLKLSEKASERVSQLERLRNFVGSGKYETRMVAVTTLGKVRDLDNVPRLLFALTDPDPRIVREADRGLRFISRKVDGVGLPEVEPSAAQIKAAQAAWRNWYLSIRPNADLLD